MFSFLRPSKKYNVDYCGKKDFYRYAKDSYPVGKKVRLEYYVIDTDTDYYFYLDDKPVQCVFKNEQFVIEFIMPAHDVKLRCEARVTFKC